MTLSTRDQGTSSAGHRFAALSKVRFAEYGPLREDRAGYTLFWSGKGKDERHSSGVDFMTKIYIARKLQNF